MRSGNAGSIDITPPCSSTIRHAALRSIRLEIDAVSVVHAGVAGAGRCGLRLSLALRRSRWRPAPPFAGSRGGKRFHGFPCRTPVCSPGSTAKRWIRPTRRCSAEGRCRRRVAYIPSVAAWSGRPPDRGAFLRQGWSGKPSVGTHRLDWRKPVGERRRRSRR